MTYLLISRIPKLNAATEIVFGFESDANLGFFVNHGSSGSSGAEILMHQHESSPSTQYEKFLNRL